MKKCVIFCAAGFDTLVAPVGDALIIAADGGLVHTQRSGITPDIILGDFDSLGYIPEGSQVFPVEKDDTDAMLAIKKGLAAGCRDFLIYGGLDGDRLDHTLANYQALQYLADRGARGTLAGLKFMATAIKNDEITFPAHYAGTVSLFCLGPDARGVDIQGLYYPMEDGSLTAGFPLGVSNHFTGKESRVSVKDGSLLILWERQAPAGHLGSPSGRAVTSAHTGD